MVNKQLLDFIKQQIDKETSKEEIKNMLLANGWTSQDVEEGFGVVEVRQAPQIPQSNQSTRSVNLVDYIKTSFNQGRSKEDVYKELLGQGHSIEAIQEGFDQMGAGNRKLDTQKKTIVIIVTIGAIFIGAGIFSFVASNWRAMTPPVKIAIVVFSMMAFYTAGWFMKNRGNVRIGNALLLLGAIVYGAGIFLIAQLFNVRENWPDGFILWMFGAIALGFATELFSLFYLAIIVAAVAIIGHPVCLIGNFGEFDDCFIGTSFFLLLAAAIVTFASGLFIRKKMPLELKGFY
ncbi:MAG: DUF2157 domain-containing protein [Patescibacteria group bacterium]